MLANAETSPFETRSRIRFRDCSLPRDMSYCTPFLLFSVVLIFIRLVLLCSCSLQGRLVCHKRVGTHSQKRLGHSHLGEVIK